MNAEELLERLPHRHPRVQRRIRILKDHLDLAPCRAGPLVGQRRPLEANLSRGRRVEARDAASERGLSAAGLAYEPEDLSSTDHEVDSVYGPQIRPWLPAKAAREVATELEPHREPSNIEQRLSHPR